MNDTAPIDHRVFVDFENTHGVDLDIVGRPGVHLTLLVGAQQGKLATDLAAKLIEHAAASRLIQIKAGGKNAVDFALACELGAAVERHASARFHIVSRDTGFDGLVGHLIGRGVRVVRHADFTSLRQALRMPGTKPSKNGTAAPLSERALAHLQKHKASRPKRKASLLRHLTAFAGKGTSAGAVEAAVASLIQAGHLRIDEKNAVTYAA